MLFITVRMDMHRFVRASMHPSTDVFYRWGALCYRMARQSSLLPQVALPDCASRLEDEDNDEFDLSLAYLESVAHLFVSLLLGFWPSPDG